MYEDSPRPEARERSRITRAVDIAGAIAAAAVFSLSVGFGQPVHAHAAAVTRAPYPQRAAGRVIAWPYAASGTQHLCHAWQRGAYAVFVLPRGRAFAARCQPIGDGSGRDAWNAVQS